MRLCVPTYLIKLACLPSAVVNGAVGLPTPVLMRIPLKGAHDLCFDKTCQGNRLAKRAEGEKVKMIRKRTWPQCDDALRNTSADLICVNIILSMAICGNLFCRAGHYFWCLQSSMKTWRRKPPCNAEDNLRVGLVVIEAWFRGY